MKTLWWEELINDLGLGRPTLSSWVAQPWPGGWQLAGLRGMRWIRIAKPKLWLGCLCRKLTESHRITTWVLWVHECWTCSPKEAPADPRLEVWKQFLQGNDDGLDVLSQEETSWRCRHTQGEKVYWSIHTATGRNSKSSEEDSSWAAERASEREGVKYHHQMFGEGLVALRWESLSTDQMKLSKKGWFGDECYRAHLSPFLKFRKMWNNFTGEGLVEMEQTEDPFLFDITKADTKTWNSCCRVYATRAPRGASPPRRQAQEGQVTKHYWQICS